MDENKGFKMKGSSLYGKLKLNRSTGNSSPVLQKNGDDDKIVQGPKTEKNVKLQPSENTAITTSGKGEPVSEKIADYEDRISFIKEDIFNQDGKSTPQQKKDMDKLKQELAIARRGNKKPPFKKKKY